MIAIIDYDAGNTFNVQKAFAYLGAQTVLTADRNRILQADGIVLPGVGAFTAAMKTLQERDLVLTLQEAAAKGIPFLGICLGMQLLFDSSTEYAEENGGETSGLGLIPGRVELLPVGREAFEKGQAILEEKNLLMVPQMGWNQNHLHNDHSIFKMVKDQYTYFVHSFYAHTDSDYITSTVDYGVPVPGVVEKGNVYGMQFHPEKSGKVGLALLQAFIDRTVC